MISPSDILNARILVVDDQKAYVLLLERMLRRAGYASIESTTDPGEVCELHRKNRYDLIVLDLQMPVTDGFQVMESLKDIEADGYVPVLVITAQPDHRLRALNAGAKDFVNKPFDLAEVLIRVHNMLEIHLLHLETKKLHDRAVADRNVLEQMLFNLLPHAVAERFKGRPDVTADSFLEGSAERFAEVTVLFANIVGFTRFSAGMSAETLVSVLNDIFTRFDSIADTRGLEKIKTIGDVYMAAAGVPVPVADHAMRAAHTALDMINAMDRFNEQNPYQLQVRIGIGTGAAVAGVIGRRKLIYDLWGEVVSTASQMESHGVSGRIQVTDSTRRQLGESFVLAERGPIDVKGMGEMQAWFLNGRN